MYKNKLFVKFIVSLTVIFILCIMLINYKIDRYKIFSSNYNNLRYEPNQNFIKIKYIMNNKKKYDSFIFGSSRVGKINPLKIENGKYYNMTYSEGLPREHYQNIKFLINNDVKIKNILIGLDDFSYKVNPEKHYSEPMRKMHYLVSGSNILNFYINYLLVEPKISALKNGNLNYDIYNTGMPITPKSIDIFIEQNREAHNKDIKFKMPTFYKENNLINETIEDIKNIISICKENNINLIFFINPIHKTTYLYNNLDNLNNFKKRLSQITNYYDFAIINSLTTNNYNFYETSHYRELVGDIILDTIYNNSTEYGLLVTKDNIDNYIEVLVEESNNK